MPAVLFGATPCRHAMLETSLTVDPVNAVTLLGSHSG